MWIRYNEASLYWEKSTDNVNFAPLEESHVADADSAFGSTAGVIWDNIGGIGNRRFSFSSATKTRTQIVIAASAVGTANPVATVGLVNLLAGPGSERRLVSLDAWTDGSNNDGAFAVSTLLAQTLTEKIRLDKDGNFWIGSAAVSYDPNASGGVIKRLTVDGGTLSPQFSMGMNQSGTANLVGSINFFNRAIGGTEKRIAFIICLTDGATNTGSFRIFTMAAGSILERMRIMGNGTIALAMQGAIATNATAGFVGIPQCAGAPTGVPASPGVNMAYIVFDTTNNKFWCYNTIAAAWKGVVLA